jgi:hypothetical protein
MGKDKKRIRSLSQFAVGNDCGTSTKRSANAKQCRSLFSGAIVFNVSRGSASGIPRSTLEDLVRRAR